MLSLSFSTLKDLNTYFLYPSAFPPSLSLYLSPSISPYPKLIHSIISIQPLIIIDPHACYSLPAFMIPVLCIQL